VHDLEFEHLHMTPEQEQEMAETIWNQDNVELTTVGVDVGSSTSHLMFSKVHLQRLSEGLSSRFVVVNREVLWRSPILLTPYQTGNTIDSDELQRFFSNAYREARLEPDDIDTGAVILTGEALKRENARAIADLFAEESGKFVCASAGHHLEALMAANGSGAVAVSRQDHKTILNIDVGGGTVKLGLCHGGRLLATSAFAVGGRLIAFDEDDRMNRIEGPARQIADDIGISLELGEKLSNDDRKAIIKRMVEVIVAYANREPDDSLCQALSLTEHLPGIRRSTRLPFRAAYRNSSMSAKPKTTAISASRWPMNFAMRWATSAYRTLSTTRVRASAPPSWARPSSPSRSAETRSLSQTPSSFRSAMYRSPISTST